MPKMPCFVLHSALLSPAVLYPDTSLPVGTLRPGAIYSLKFTTWIEL